MILFNSLIDFIQESYKFRKIYISKWSVQHYNEPLSYMLNSFDSNNNKICYVLSVDTNYNNPTIIMDETYIFFKINEFFKSLNYITVDAKFNEQIHVQCTNYAISNIDNFLSETNTDLLKIKLDSLIEVHPI